MPSWWNKNVLPLMNADERGSKTNCSSAFISVHQRLTFFFLSVVLSQAAFAQIPVVTVCEALQDRVAYHQKSIIVVGRLVSSDEGSWLGEDCTLRVVTDGFAWPNVVSTTYIRGQVEPPPSVAKNFRWDSVLLASKLKDVQKTTKLESSISGKWVAIFGRFETRIPLQVVHGGSRGQLMGYGFGHLNYAPAQLISDEQGFRELESK